MLLKMNLKKGWFKAVGVVFLLLMVQFLSSCSLNAEQEATLSESTTNYTEARKAGALLAYVSIQHPLVVRYYKEKGDSAFLKKFTVEPKDYFSEDPVIRRIEKQDDDIHVLYEAKIIQSEWESGGDEVRRFVALSENNGRNWFFIDWSDYVDKSIATGLIRLIDL